MAHETSENESGSGLLSKIVRVLAYPVSAGAGYWVARRRIYDSAYDNAKFHGVFGDEGKILRDGEMVDHYEALKQEGKKACEALQRGEMYDIVAATKDLHAGHAADVEKGLKSVGLGTLGKQWKFTNPHQKNMALLDGFAIAGISIGALLTMANSKTVSNLFSRDKDDGKSV